MTNNPLVAMDWKSIIHQRLESRNATETDSFQNLINFCELNHRRTNCLLYGLKLIVFFPFLDNKLYDSSLLLRAQNVQLESQIIRGHASVDLMLSDKISTLEQKLLVQQEELTELHRRRGENAQMIIDLNAKLQLTEQTIAHKNYRSVIHQHTSTYFIRFLFRY